MDWPLLASSAASDGRRSIGFSRGLSRAVGLSLATVVLSLALLHLPTTRSTNAAAIPVGPTCSLVDAIHAANTDRPMGGCPAGNGADTILLEARRYALRSEFGVPLPEVTFTALLPFLWDRSHGNGRRPHYPRRHRNLNATTSIAISGSDDIGDRFARHLRTIVRFDAVVTTIAGLEMVAMPALIVDFLGLDSTPVWARSSSWTWSAWPGGR